MKGRGVGEKRRICVSFLKGREGGEKYLFYTTTPDIRLPGVRTEATKWPEIVLRV